MLTSTTPMLALILASTVAGLPEKGVWPPPGIFNDMRSTVVFSDAGCRLVFIDWFRDPAKYPRQIAIHNSNGAIWIPVESAEAKIFDPQTKPYPRVAIHKCDDTRSEGVMKADKLAPARRRTGFFMTCPDTMHVLLIWAETLFMRYEVRLNTSKACHKSERQSVSLTMKSYSLR